MTLPLTNIIDCTNYIETSIKVMHEFLAEFFNPASGYDADIRMVKKKITSPLEKPVVTVIFNPGISQKRGPVKYDAGVIQGKFKNLSWDIMLVTDDSTGGPLKLDRYAAKLEAVFNEASFYLGEKGLRNNNLFGPTQIDLNNYYQRTFILANQLLLSWAS